MPKTRSSPTTVLLAPALATWGVFVADALTPGRIGHGIIPRTVHGLYGIAMAPFIHGNLQHLIANSIPFLILGAIILLRGTRALTTVMLVSALVSGAGIWLFGAPNTHHIGASGVVFGFFGYVLLRGVYDRRASSIVIAIAIAFLYGAAMLSSLVPVAGVSWTGHVFGFAGGVTAARLRYAR